MKRGERKTIAKSTWFNRLVILRLMRSSDGTWAHQGDRIGTFGFRRTSDDSGNAVSSFVVGEYCLHVGYSKPIVIGAY